jgi:hypothetical protein
MARKLILSGFMSALLLVSVVAYSLPAFAQGPDSSKTPQVVLAFGKVPGQDLFAHVWIVVPHGADKKQTIDESLRQQGLKPFSHSDFSLNERTLPQFNDQYTDNDFFTQYYNDANQPTGVSHLTLIASQDIWTSVTSSNFAFDVHDDDNDLTTDRCPSIVRECPGKQFPDGFSDVAWMQIRDKNTLGVTWYYSSLPEADIALNTNFSWEVNSTTKGIFDPLTVLIHEEGHIIGLGHSKVDGAIMEAVYDGKRQTLHLDDICGIQTIYGTPQSCGDQPSDPVDPQPGTATDAIVTYGMNKGKLQVQVNLKDESNNPVPKTSVTIIVSSDSASSGSTTKTTNDNGLATWNFRGVPGGYYTTQITHVDGNVWNGNTVDPGFLK